MSWPSVELAAVADINPRMPRGLANDQGVSFLPMAAVSEDGQIDYQEQRTVEDVRKGYTYFRRGDVLVAKITPCFENGKATKTEALNEEHGFGSTEFHVIRVNPDEMLPEYAFHLIWNPYFRKEATANMTGSAGQKRVPADFLKRLNIPLPPLEEQRRIAGILDAADALRRRRREALALLDTLPGAIFAEMFGGTRGCAEDGDASNVTLASVAEINPRMPRGLPEDMEVAFLPMAAVSVDGLISYQERRTVSQVRKGYTYFQRGDLLLAKITPCFENGKAAKTDMLETEYGFGTTEFHVVRTNSDELLSDYAFHLIWNPTFRKDGAANMTGSAGQKRLPVDYLKRMRIPVPSLEEQQTFVDRVLQIQNQRDVYSRQIMELDNLFSSLQSRAFAGAL